MRTCESECAGFVDNPQVKRIISRVYIQGHKYREVMSAVPYTSGFIFRFAVFLITELHHELWWLSPFKLQCWQLNCMEMFGSSPLWRQARNEKTPPHILDTVNTVNYTNNRYLSKYILATISDFHEIKKSQHGCRWQSHIEWFCLQRVSNWNM